MLQPHPAAAGNSKRGLEILKGDHNAVHRQITENDIISRHRKGQQIKQRMVSNIIQKTPAQRRTPYSEGFCVQSDSSLPENRRCAAAARKIKKETVLWQDMPSAVSMRLTGERGRTAPFPVKWLTVNGR